MYEITDFLRNEKGYKIVSVNTPYEGGHVFLYNALTDSIIYPIDRNNPNNDYVFSHVEQFQDKGEGEYYLVLPELYVGHITDKLNDVDCPFLSLAIKTFRKINNEDLNKRLYLDKGRLEFIINQVTGKTQNFKEDINTILAFPQNKILSGVKIP